MNLNISYYKVLITNKLVILYDKISSKLYTPILIFDKFVYDRYSEIYDDIFNKNYDIVDSISGDFSEVDIYDTWDDSSIIYETLISDSTIINSNGKMYNSQNYVGGLESIYNSNLYSLGIGFETTSYGNYVEDQMNTISISNISGDSLNFGINYTIDGYLNVIYVNEIGNISAIYSSATNLSGVSLKVAIGTSSLYGSVKDLSGNVLVNFNKNYVSASNLSLLRFFIDGNGNNVNRYFTSPIIYTNILDSDLNNFVLGNNITAIRKYW